MPQQTKIFRVFVSSTFTDMKEERRILQKNVFPKLEEFCQQNGAKFQAVDLRWGVNEESQLNQKTLDICINEIARCQRISPKPNFLILLGDKYGWQPLPTKIPEEEMRLILNNLQSDQKIEIEKWYRLDENAIPSEYVIQPRGEEYAAYGDWEQNENKLRTILRGAVSNLSFTDEQRVKYFTSATHQEIINGALNPPEETEKPEEHVLAMIREIKGFPQDKSAEGFIDLIDRKPDDYSKDQLNNLKSELRKKLGEHCVTYPAKWNKGMAEINDLPAFESSVYNFLKDIIKGQIEIIISPDEIERETKLHSEFKEKLTEHFCGRDEILKKISTYLNTKSENQAMVIIGDPGSGKSSVMAQAVQNYATNNLKSLVIYRFIGTTSASSNIISLLLNIYGAITKEFNTTVETLAGEGGVKSLHEINVLAEIFRECLSLASEAKPLVIFLDALDQLSETDNAQALYWLPKELPPNSKIIVSSLPKLENKLADVYLEHLPLLPEPEAVQILEKWLQSIKRKLTKAQYNEIIKRFNKNGLALYLKLAFEKARHWHSYDKDYSLQNDVKGIINDYMSELEKEHTCEFVQNAICYMLSGRYQGLAENEILEILVFDKEYWQIFLDKTHPEHKIELDGVSQIPIAVWSRLYLDMEPFLTERDADGVPIITFFHRQFIEVLRERYDLIEEDNRN